MGNESKRSSQEEAIDDWGYNQANTAIIPCAKLIYLTFNFFQVLV